MLRRLGVAAADLAAADLAAPADLAPAATFAAAFAADFAAATFAADAGARTAFTARTFPGNADSAADAGAPLTKPGFHRWVSSAGTADFAADAEAAYALAYGPSAGMCRRGGPEA